MDRPVRVLFLEAQASPASDSNVHALLMRHFDRRRLQVHVACNPGSEGQPSATLQRLESIPDITVLRASFGSPLSTKPGRHVGAAIPSGIAATRALFRLAAHVRHHQIDVIHASSRPRDAALAVALGKLTGARSVIHLHLKCAEWFSPIMRWALRECDAILGVSDFVARSALAAGYPRTRTYHVLNSLDLDDWDARSDGATIRREFGIGPDDPLLAIASRLFYWKGHTELLRALALVRRQVPEVKLLVVGADDPDAHPGGPSYLMELEALARQLDLTDQVVFAGFRADVQAILAACDVYTMPSFEEPCAMAYLEAMAMEKPVIALDSGGTPELVEHGKAGLLSPPEDIEALAGNILTLVTDPRLRRQMGAYGRLRVAEHHTPRRMADAVEDVYRAILDREAVGNRVGVIRWTNS